MRSKLIKGRSVSGWKPDRPDHRDHIFEAPRLSSVLAASIVDNASFCSRVEDQQWIGSCTACAATSAMEMLARKLGLVRKQYSRLFVYYQTRVEIERSDPGDDSGAYIRDTVKCLKNFGACPERFWPYQPSDFSTAPSPDALKRGLRNQVTEYLRCPNLAAIKSSIALQYPVIGGFAVPENIFSDECEQTGIIRYPSDFEAIIGGHAVLFVGYDDNTKLLKFINSWGMGWGAQGYGFLPYKFVNTGMANDFWTIRMQEGNQRS